MVLSETFAFFDLETTGLPYMERNQTKIIEFCILTVSRSDILSANSICLPPSRKLSFLLNPEHVIPHPMVLELTGISLGDLKSAPTFSDMYETIENFLKSLPQPVCLVAHNGNTFDYKILLAEVNDIGKKLPEEVLCLDSLIAFRQLHKENLLKYPSDDISTIDEWPDLNITPQEWDEIDDLCETLSKVSTNSLPTSQRSVSATVKKSSKQKSSNKQTKNSFALTSLYERLINKSCTNAHRAEVDCQMLLECTVAAKDVFIPWADRNCKPLKEIKALTRY